MPNKPDTSHATMTPREIVQELDRHIVGQQQAKRAVAIALRNRWRRQQLPDDLREEVLPKNILMIGPTGVGKTEIARRLARLADAPFIKVEATKFTEVGYVGRDVEQIIRDLLEIAMNQSRERLRRQVAASGDRVLAALLEEVRAFGAGPAEERGAEAADGVAVPMDLDTPRGRMSFLSTTMVFGTPTEVTLSELAIEAFYPADARTAALLAGR